MHCLRVSLILVLTCCVLEGKAQQKWAVGTDYGISYRHLAGTSYWDKKLKDEFDLSGMAQSVSLTRCFGTKNSKGALLLLGRFKYFGYYKDGRKYEYFEDTESYYLKETFVRLDLGLGYGQCLIQKDKYRLCLEGGLSGSVGIWSRLDYYNQQKEFTFFKTDDQGEVHQVERNFSWICLSLRLQNKFVIGKQWLGFYLESRVHPRQGKLLAKASGGTLLYDFTVGLTYSFGKLE